MWIERNCHLDARQNFDAGPPTKVYARTSGRP